MTIAIAIRCNVRPLNAPVVLGLNCSNVAILCVISYVVIPCITMLKDSAVNAPLQTSDVNGLSIRFIALH